MATEVASAYVSIGASTKGLGKAISKEFAGVEAQADKTGSRISSRIGGALQTVGKAVTGAVAVAGGAVAALALKGGFDRALALDNAQAKMVALGYSAADVESVMDSALRSVKGTAFGLGDAASLASQYLAAGIDMGEDLDRALTAAADAAAVANVPLSDMQLVFGQLASGSQLYTQDLLQLQSRGLPVFSWLADSMGTSVDEVRKMVSAGQLGFADFQKAIEENIGGAAKATDSFSASWNNTRAALSRAGAVFAVPGLAVLKELLDAAIPAIDAMATAIEPLATAFFERLAPGIEAVKTTLADFADGGFSLPSIDLGGLLSGIVPAIQNGIQQAANWLADGGIQMLADGFLEGRMALFDAFVDIVPVVIEALETIIPSLGDLVVQIVSTLATFVPMAIDTLVTLLPGLWAAGTAVFETLLDALATVLPQVLTMLAEALPQILNTVGAMAPELLMGAVGSFLSLIEALGVILPELLTVLTEQVLPQLIDTFITMGPPLLDAGLVAFLALVNALTDVLPVLLDAILNDFIPAITDMLIENAPALLAAAFQMWLAVQGAIAKALPSILTALGKMLLLLVQNALKTGPRMLQAGLSMLGKLGDGFAQAWPSIREWFSGRIEAITGWFRNAGTWLVDAGRRIIDGLIQGLKNGFQKVRDTLGNLTDMLPDWKGPARVDSEVLVKSGQLVMGGFKDGLEDGMSTTERMLRGFTNNLAVAGSFGVDMSDARTAGLNRSDLDYLADRIAQLMGLESERGTSSALSSTSKRADLLSRMGVQ